MGIYLNGGKLGKTQKAVELRAWYGAITIPEPEWEDVQGSLYLKCPWSKELIICVLENGLFDAAIVINSRDDYECCIDDKDQRRRTWLMVDREKVKDLC
jgi:hypothetical protein